MCGVVLCTLCRLLFGQKCSLVLGAGWVGESDWMHETNRTDEIKFNLTQSHELSGDTFHRLPTLLCSPFGNSL